MTSEQEAQVFEKFGPVIAFRPGGYICDDRLVLSDTRDTRVVKIVSVQWQERELERVLEEYSEVRSVEGLARLFNVSLPESEFLPLKEVTALLRREEVKGFLVQVEAVTALSFGKDGSFFRDSLPMGNQQWFYAEQLCDEVIQKMLIDWKRINAQRARGLALKSHYETIVEEAAAAVAPVPATKRPRQRAREKALAA